jgi:hypothetical protein
MTTPHELRPRGVHLVGSIPLGSAEEVFRLAGARLGERLRRLPDGETGERADWIGWQFGVLARTPQLETVAAVPGRYAARPHVKVRSGADAAALAFGPLGYAEAAVASYTMFAALQSAGVLPPRYRFQVSLPTPIAVVTAFVERADRALVEPAYTARLLAELEEITAVIPHNHLAIQWDVAIEVGILEGVIPSHLADARAMIVDRLVGLGNQVPPATEVGYHLCYGDAGHRHFKEPADTALLVDLATTLSAGVQRPITWFHMPVPRDRTDAAYYAPLRALTLAPTTELYLGLVHYTDGVEGTQRRIAAAQQAVDHFGVATECGMGRRPPDTIPRLLDIHAEVAAAAGAGD